MISGHVRGEGWAQDPGGGACLSIGAMSTPTAHREEWLQVASSRASVGSSTGELDFAVNVFSLNGPGQHPAPCLDSKAFAWQGCLKDFGFPGS